MVEKIVHHDRPGLVGEPVRVPMGYTKMTIGDDNLARCEWFDNDGEKTDEYWIFARSVK